MDGLVEDKGPESVNVKVLDDGGYGCCVCEPGSVGDSGDSDHGVEVGDGVGGFEV